MNDQAVDFVLANAERRHAERPRSFFIPKREERESLAVGDAAKLLFELIDPTPDAPGGERMWVEVTDRLPQGYGGVLMNQPSAITTIQRGDTLRFGPEHVIAVVEDWPLLEKRVIVTRRGHEQDLRPRHVYREDPTSDQDSGWTALIGDESDEELQDRSQLLAQALGYLLDRWPELEPVFKSDPVNREWVWSEAIQAYEALDPPRTSASPKQTHRFARRRWRN